MYLPDSAIQNALAYLLKVADFGALAPYWTDIVADAHDQAFNDIQIVLLRRGFTPAQVGAWDQGRSFERRQSLYWCLVYGAGLHNYDGKFIAALDCAARLTNVEVSNNGVWQAPGFSAPGQAFVDDQVLSGSAVGFPPPATGSGREYGRPAYGGWEDSPWFFRPN